LLAILFVANLALFQYDFRPKQEWNLVKRSSMTLIHASDAVKLLKLSFLHARGQLVHHVALTLVFQAVFLRHCLIS
jgi:hypothetical protein